MTADESMVHARWSIMTIDLLGIAASRLALPVIASITLTLCTACVTHAPYRQTAEVLHKELFEWKPLGKDGWYELSDDESARMDQHLESCIGELDSQ